MSSTGASQASKFNPTFYGGTAGLTTAYSDGADRNQTHITELRTFRTKYGVPGTLCDYNAMLKITLPNNAGGFQEIGNRHNGCQPATWAYYNWQSAIEYDYPVGTVLETLWIDVDTGGVWKWVATETVPSSAKSQACGNDFGINCNL